MKWEIQMKGCLHNCVIELCVKSKRSELNCIAPFVCPLSCDIFFFFFSFSLFFVLCSSAQIPHVFKMNTHTEWHLNRNDFLILNKMVMNKFSVFSLLIWDEIVCAEIYIIVSFVCFFVYVSFIHHRFGRKMIDSLVF